VAGRCDGHVARSPGSARVARFQCQSRHAEGQHKQQQRWRRRQVCGAVQCFFLLFNNALNFSTLRISVATQLSLQ
jgi:hypothetical protein